MPPPIESYYRVWAALARTEAEHIAAHDALWKTSDKARVVRLLTQTVSGSSAAEGDRVAVLAHIAEDWQTARNLASLASSATCWSGGPFGDSLRRLREERNLSREQLAESAGLTRQAIHLYESGERRPTWDAVQALAKALNVPTDAFRDA